MFPKVKLEVGFASEPTDPIAQTTWTDVTAYMLDVSGSNGGRQYELDESQAGVMNVTLDNRDRRFEPEYASSPYYPNVVPMRRIRLTVGENAVSNPSFETDTTGWSVAAQFSIARSTTQALMGDASLKSTYVSGTTSADMGTSAVTVPAAGRYAFTTYAYVPTAWNGGTISVQALNFAGSSEVTASRVDANMVARDQWQRITRVYDIVGGDLVGSLSVRCSSFPTGTPFIYTDGFQVATLDMRSTLQPYVDQPYEKFTGYVEEWPPVYQTNFSAVTISCVDGFEPLAQAAILGGPNLVTNPSFETDTSAWTASNGTITRDTTRAVAGVAAGKLTANAATSPSDARPDSLGLEAGNSYAMSARIWIPSGLSITASDVTVGLGYTGGTEVAGTALSLFDQWQTVVLPQLFTGAEQIRTFGLTTPGTGLTLMQGDTASNGDPVGNNKQVSKFTLSDPAVITSIHLDITGHGGAGPQQLVKAVIYSDSSGLPGALLGESTERTIPRNTSLRQFEQFDLADPVTVAAGDYWIGYIGGETSQSLYIGSVTSGGSRAYNTDSYFDGAASSFGPATTDSLELAVYATYTVSLASTSYGFIRIAETGSSKYVNFDEVVIRQVPATDGDLADPAGADLSEAQVGFRIHRLLNAASWPVDDRAIDDGTSTVADETIGSDASTKNLETLRSAALADLGLFFCNAAGDAVFHGRARRFNPAPVFTLTDGTVAPDSFPYIGLTPSYDKTRIANDVRITPAVGETQIVSDTTSTASYMQRTLTESLSLPDEDQAQYLAQGILFRRKDPHLRFDSLSVHPVAHEARQPGFLNRILSSENSDAVSVVLHPPGGGAAVTKTVHREQAQFQFVKPAFLVETWQLSPADTNTYMEADDATLGLLDSGNLAAF